MQSELWRRVMLLLSTLEAILAVALFPLSVYNIKVAIGWDPSSLATASINLAILSVINIVVAGASVRILLAQTFFEIALLIYVACGGYLISILAYGGKYLGSLSLQDPWYTSDDICYDMPSEYGKNCKVDKTYIATYVIAAILLTTNIAILLLVLFGRIRNITTPFRRPASRFFAVLLHGKKSVVSQLSADTQREKLPERPHKSPITNSEITYVDGKAELPASGVAPTDGEQQQPTAVAQVRTFWENGVQYQIVPIPVENTPSAHGAVNGRRGDFISELPVPVDNI